MTAFAHPLFLMALGLLVAPLLIHFLTRPQPRVIPYPTFHLLLEAGQGRQVWHRLRTWLVLILRTLALAALVLLFARPYLAPQNAPPREEGGQRVVLVIDASLSMTAVQGGISLFSRAKAQAAEVLRHLDHGSYAAVLFMGARPQPVLPALSRNLNALHTRLTTWQPTLEKGDPQAALALAKRLLGTAGKVYIFSDFQRNDWRELYHLRSFELDLILRPITTAGIHNVGITKVSTIPTEPIQGERFELQGTLFNATPDRLVTTVHLDLPGRTYSAEIALAPYASGSVLFTLTFPQSGCHSGTLTLPPDALNSDNQRFFKLCIRQTLDLLLLSDRDPNDISSGAFFLAKALLPSPQAAPGFSLQHRHSQDLDQQSLASTEIFFLVPPLQLNENTADQLVARVRNGASLLLFLNDQPIWEALSRWATRFPELSLPFQRTGPALTHATGTTLAPIPTGQGPLALLTAPGQGDLEGLRFYRHYPTVTTPERSTEILLHYADGAAALALSKVGQGQIIYANLPLVPSHTTLVGSPLFPVVLHELLYTLRQRGQAPEHWPGHELQLTLPSAMLVGQQTQLHITGPKGWSHQIRPFITDGQAQLLLPPVQRPGYYYLQGEDQPIAIVNTHPDETDTRQWSQQELSAQGSTLQVVAEDELATLGKTQELWPYLVFLLGFLLALEMGLLAWWRAPLPLSRTAR